MTENSAPQSELCGCTAERQGAYCDAHHVWPQPETAGRYQGRRREPVLPIAPDYVDDPTATASQMIRPYVLPDNRTKLPETYVLRLEVTAGQWAWLDELMAYAIQRADQGAAPADGRETRALYYAWCNQVLTAEREYQAVAAAAAAVDGVAADGVPFGPITEWTSPESVWEAPAETYGWKDLWGALDLPDHLMTAVQSWSNLGADERITRAELEQMVVAWHADQGGPEQLTCTCIETTSHQDIRAGQQSFVPGRDMCEIHASGHTRPYPID